MGKWVRVNSGVSGWEKGEGVGFKWGKETGERVKRWKRVRGNGGELVNLYSL